MAKANHHQQKLGATTVTVTVLHKTDLISTTQEPLATVLNAVEENPELILLENLAHPHEFTVELPNTGATGK